MRLLPGHGHQGTGLAVRGPARRGESEVGGAMETAKAIERLIKCCSTSRAPKRQGKNTPTNYYRKNPTLFSFFPTLFGA